MVDNDTAINDVNNNDREEEIAENDPLSFNSFSRSFDNSSLLSLELNEVIKWSKPLEKTSEIKYFNVNVV